MKGNADRNASLVIGQRLIARYGQASQEKPQTPLLRRERGEKSPGVAVCQDAKGQEEPSLLQAGHADRNEHGTGAPYQRQNMSATEVVKVVGKPSAHLTYPCRKA